MARRRSYDPDGYNRWCDRSVEFAKRYFVPVMVFRSGEIPAVGSGCIVRYDGSDYLITAGHVVQPLEEYGEEGRLQIGPDRFTLRNALPRIEIRTVPDVAVMRLDAEELRGTRSQAFPAPKIFYIPLLRRMVVCVGNLGATKRLTGPRNLHVTCLKIFGLVDSIEPDQFSVRIDPERYSDRS